MGDPLSDCSPLISAAASGKLRLVRLLVEGGSQVNGRNPRGETALLAACKALRGEPDGPDTVKLLTYLLQNKADPNVQDCAGRTALMYACMERAGAQVASSLLSAGADPSMEDCSGASALVYAINAQHQPTLKVLMDACRARGHDIIIIATELGVNGGPVTRRYLNVPPSPGTSPVSCMSPSDIVLKTGSPDSAEGENIFNFRGTGKRGSSSSSHPPRGTPPPRQRMLSEPRLAVHNLALLNVRTRSQQDGGDLGIEGTGKEKEHGVDEESRFLPSRMEQMRGNYNSRHEDLVSRVSQSLLSLTETSLSQETLNRLTCKRCVTPEVSTSDKTSQKSSLGKLPPCPSLHTLSRRNTLPSVMVVSPLPLLVSQSDSHLQVTVSQSKSRSMVFLPHPPNSTPPSSSSTRASPVSSALLPSLPPVSPITSLVSPPATCCADGSRRSLRRHSVQLKQVGVETGARTNPLNQ